MLGGNTFKPIVVRSHQIVALLLLWILPGWNVDFVNTGGIHPTGQRMLPVARGRNNSIEKNCSKFLKN